VSFEAVITGAAEPPYQRHPDPGITTQRLLADAFVAALENAGARREDVDGLGVSSFTLGPDNAIDLAWKLGVDLRWLMQDTNGGASALNLLQHAVRAIEAGDAETIVLLAGDRLLQEEFERLRDSYNSATRDWLTPLPFGGPNTLFSFLTQRHMNEHGLDREDYAQVPLAQRRWAARNPGAVYRSPLTLEEYVAAPMVARPLCRYDCVPVVSGADAVVVARSRAGGRGHAVRVKAIRACYNPDNQESDGLSTGLARVADELWSQAGVGPSEIDLAYPYDDYPAMALVQLADLGLVRNGDVRRFLHEDLAKSGRPVNTSGGQLSAGQAGAAGGMHGLVEAVVQLRGEAGERQVEGARTALVTGYGMVLYRYGACANAAVLEREP
jgi:acetyl-CoA acetyltransferase